MNKLKSWLAAGRGRGAALAAYLVVPPSFVTKMADGEKPIPVRHMAAIEAFTCGEVTRQEMCPAEWQTIWPELADPEQKQPLALDGESVVAIEKMAT